MAGQAGLCLLQEGSETGVELSGVLDLVARRTGGEGSDVWQPGGVYFQVVAVEKDDGIPRLFDLPRGDIRIVAEPVEEIAHILGRALAERHVPDGRGEPMRPIDVPLGLGVGDAVVNSVCKKADQKSLTPEILDIVSSGAHCTLRIGASVRRFRISEEGCHIAFTGQY